MLRVRKVASNDVDLKIHSNGRDDVSAARKAEDLDGNWWKEHPS